MNDPENQNLLEDLAKRIPPERITESIEQLLDASHVTKSGNIIPDHRTRLQAVTLCLNYFVGKPLEMRAVIQKSVSAGEGELPQHIFRQSKALRERFRKAIEEADAWDGEDP